MSDSTLAVGSQIHLGHSMITFIEPHRGEGLHEYNRWYEHDHAYAAMTAAPGCFAYRRYVATRRLKNLALPRRWRGGRSGGQRLVHRPLLDGGGARRRHIRLLVCSRPPTCSPPDV